MQRDLDLDVAAPDQVAAVLRRAAEAYYELEAAWQDRGAGAPWRVVARELDWLADRLEHLI